MLRRGVAGETSPGRRGDLQARRRPSRASLCTPVLRARTATAEGGESSSACASACAAGRDVAGAGAALPVRAPFESSSAASAAEETEAWANSPPAQRAPARGQRARDLFKENGVLDDISPLSGSALTPNVDAVLRKSQLLFEQLRGLRLEEPSEPSSRWDSSRDPTMEGSESDTCSGPLLSPGSVFPERTLSILKELTNVWDKLSELEERTTKNEAVSRGKGFGCQVAVSASTASTPSLSPPRTRSGPTWPAEPIEGAPWTDAQLMTPALLRFCMARKDLHLDAASRGAGVPRARSGRALTAPSFLLLAAPRPEPPRALWPKDPSGSRSTFTSWPCEIRA